MEQTEIAKMVDDLELSVDRLRVLYDQYFSGIEKMEPSVARRDVERRLDVLRRQQIRATGTRFRYQVIVQRYNTYQTYWLRICRQIENGTYKRDVRRAMLRFGNKEEGSAESVQTTSDRTAGASDEGAHVLRTADRKAASEESTAWDLGDDGVSLDELAKEASRTVANAQAASPARVPPPTAGAQDGSFQRTETLDPAPAKRIVIARKATPSMSSMPGVQVPTPEGASSNPSSPAVTSPPPSLRPPARSAPSLTGMPAVNLSANAPGALKTSGTSPSVPPPRPISVIPPTTRLPTMPSIPKPPGVATVQEPVRSAPTPGPRPAGLGTARDDNPVPPAQPSVPPPAAKPKIVIRRPSTTSLDVVSAKELSGSPMASSPQGATRNT